MSTQATLASSPDFQNTFVPGSADQGAANAFAQGLHFSLKSGVGTQGYRFVADRLRDAEALNRGETPLTKEQFDAEGFSIPGQWEWREGMSVATALRGRERALDMLRRQRSAGAGDHWAASLAGGLVGGFGDPGNLLAAVALPQSTAVNLSRGAALSVRASTALRAVELGANAGISGFRDALITESLNYPISQANQWEYTPGELFINFAASGIASSGFRMAQYGLTSRFTPEIDQVIAKTGLKSTLNGHDGNRILSIRGQAEPGNKFVSRIAEKIDEMTQRQADQPPPLPGEQTAAPSSLTPEADALLRSVDDGGVPGFISRNLERIANENGVEVTKQMTPTDVINALRAKKTGRTSVDEEVAWMVGELDEAAPGPQSHVTDPQATRADLSRRATIADIIRKDPSTRRVARTGDEGFLQNAWQAIFGVEVRFIDPAMATRWGVHGFASKTEPNVIYVRAGGLDPNNPTGMLQIAGHELGHNIRFRDAGMWGDMVKSMLELSTDAQFARAYEGIVRHRNQKASWHSLSREGKVDEVMSNLLGEAMADARFWKALPDRSQQKLRNVVEDMRSRYMAWAYQKKNVLSAAKGPGDSFARGLGQILTAAEEAGVGLASREGLDPNGMTLRSLYAPHMARARERMREAQRRMGNKALDEVQDMMDVFIREDLNETQTAEEGTVRMDRPEVMRFEKTVIPGHDPRMTLLNLIFKNIYGDPRLAKAVDDFRQGKYHPGKTQVPRKHDRTVVKGGDRAVIQLGILERARLRETRKQGIRDKDVTLTDPGRFLEEDIFPLVHIRQVEGNRYEFIITDPGEGFVRWYEGRNLDVEWDMLELRSLVGDEMQSQFDSLLKDYGSFLPEQMPREAITRHLEEFLLQETISPTDRPEHFWSVFRDFVAERVARETTDDTTQVEFLTKFADEMVSLRREPSRAQDKSQEARRAEKQQAALGKMDSRLAELVETVQEAKALQQALREMPDLGRGMDPLGYPLHDSRNPIYWPRVKEATWREIEDTMVDAEFDRIAEEMPFESSYGPNSPLIAIARALGEKIDPEEMRNLWRRDVHTQAKEAVKDVLYPIEQYRMRRAEKLIDLEARDRVTLSEEGPEFRDGDDYSLLNELNRERMLEEGAQSMESWDLARFGDLIDEETAFRTIDEVAQRQERMEKDTFARVTRNFKQLLSRVSLFAKDPKTAHVQLLRDLATDHGLPDITKRLWFAEVDPLKLGDEGMALARKLYDMERKGLSQIKRLTDWREGRLNEAEFAGLAPHAYDSWMFHSRQGLSDREVMTATLADIETRGRSEMVGTIRGHDFTTKFRTLLAGRNGLNQVYSFLDGHMRKGVKSPGSPVYRKANVRVQEAMEVFSHTLRDTGLSELWANDRRLPYEERLLPKVLAAMRGQEWATADPELGPKIKQLAQVVKDLNEYTVARLNEAGAYIRLLDNHLFTATHNPFRMRAAGFDRWAEFVMEHGDWDMIGRSAGVGESPVVRMNYLKEVWSLLTDEKGRRPENFDEIVRLGNTADSQSTRRTLHFRDTYAYDYDMLFGSANTSGHMVASWARDLHLATMMETFGHKFRANFDEILPDLMRAEDMNANLKDRILDKVNLPKWKRIKGTFDHITGDMNTPVDVVTAAYGQAARGYAHSSVGWTSGVASLTDQGNIISTLRMFGALNGLRADQAYFNALKEQAKVKDNYGYLTGSAVGMQAFLTAYGKVTAMDGSVFRVADALKDFTMKYSGLEGATRISAIAMADVVSQAWARADLDSLSPEALADFRNWLTKFNLTEAEWRRAYADLLPDMEDGIQRLTVDMIRDPNLREKLRIAMHETISYGVLEPSPSTTAWAAFFTKAGTPTGEAMRSIGHYKTYPLTVVTKSLSRFDNGYEGHQSAWVERLVWSTMLMSLAVGVLAIKDVLRGREPFNPFDPEQWTYGNISRWVAQAGTGPFMVWDQFSTVGGAIGPAPGMVYRAGTAAASGDPVRMTNAGLGVLPGASFGPTNELQKSIVASIWEAYDIRRRQIQAWQAEEMGRGRLLELGD